MNSYEDPFGAVGAADAVEDSIIVKEKEKEKDPKPDKCKVKDPLKDVLPDGCPPDETAIQVKPKCISEKNLQPG